MAGQRLERFIHELMSARGTPYQWGGTNLQTGVDCSGLIWEAARLAGIKGVARTSQEQFAQGHPVPMNQLRPGDLIFSHWGSEQGAGHVSIYLGNGKIIEAAGQGIPVRVTSMSVLQGHILGARTLQGVSPGAKVPDAAGFAQKQIAYYRQANPAAFGAATTPIQLPQLPALPTAQDTLAKITAPSTPTMPVGSPAATAPMHAASTALQSQLDQIHQSLLPAMKVKAL